MQVTSRIWERSKAHLLDILMLLTLSILVFFGAFWKYFDLQSNAWYYSDVARYACYAHGFWQGTTGLLQLPRAQCSFLLPFSSSQPLHTLPREYPLLVLIPFSLALVAPMPLYHVAFASLMAVLMSVTYFTLKYARTSGAALAFLFYVLLGCWSTAAGRFDLLPALLTLLALVYAEKHYWRCAFTLLALATMSKFYPLILIPPFFIAQQMNSKERWHSWRRLVPVGVFAAVCMALFLLSFSLNRDGTLAPLSYFQNRPIQIESLSASLLWLTSVSGRYTLTYTFDFGSRNVSSVLSPSISLTGTLLLLIGLMYTWWLQWRRKMTLPFAALLTLLIVIVTGKVFSPQYLLWVAPLLAYVGEANRKWLLGWGGVSIVTTLIYPCLYERKYFAFLPFLPPLDPTIFVRNVLLLLFVACLLVTVARRPSQHVRLDEPAIHEKKHT